ncbi:hypothetical protein [Streptomyces tubercidicus]
MTRPGGPEPALLTIAREVAAALQRLTAKHCAEPASTAPAQT